ncbi:hypothetical protein [Desulforapulum autotrophicum]|nr:hypothetical protein [Desulforapulum autotrophicum]
MKQMGNATKIKKAELNKASQDEKTRGRLIATDKIIQYQLRRMKDDN